MTFELRGSIASDSTWTRPGVFVVGSGVQVSPESFERKIPLKVPTTRMSGFCSDCVNEWTASFLSSGDSRQVRPPSVDLKKPPASLCRCVATYKTFELRGSTTMWSTNKWARLKFVNRRQLCPASVEV